jgi:hypothetical protein
MSRKPSFPPGQFGLAAGLVRAAKFVEKDTSDRALHLVSDLLANGDLRNIGKAGARLAPFVFDKIFGSKLFSFRFISRSVIATTLFWLLLLLLKQVELQNLIEGTVSDWVALVIVVPLWYILDWLSLAKAKFLMTMISARYSVISSCFFLCIDILKSYVLAGIFNVTFAVIYFSYYIGFNVDDTFTDTLDSHSKLTPFFHISLFHQATLA